jgi:hypothetical protein
MSLFFALVTATFAGMCVYALVRARRALAESLRVRRLLGDARVSRVGDLAPGARAIVAGRVSGAGGATVSAPFTGRSVLWARAKAQTNVGATIAEWGVAVDELLIEDDAGGVASVPLGRATVRLPEASVTGTDARARIGAFFESIRRSPTAGELYYEAALLPGDAVSVFGLVASPDESYRAPANVRHLVPADGELIVFDDVREDGEPELRRRYMRAAVLGIVFFGLLTLGLAYAGLR